MTPDQLVGSSVRCPEHLEHPLKPFGAYDVTNAYQLGIVRGDTHGQVTLVDLEDQIGLILAFYGASLDRFDASSPVMAETTVSPTLKDMCKYPFR